jgi:hypothetical protein
MATHIKYGDPVLPEPPPKPSRDSIEAEQAQLLARRREIADTLENESPTDYRRQELQTEDRSIIGMIAANDVLLNPNEVDPEQAERHRFSASRGTTSLNRTPMTSRPGWERLLSEISEWDHRFERDRAPWIELAAGLAALTVVVVSLLAAAR